MGECHPSEEESPWDDSAASLVPAGVASAASIVAAGVAPSSGKIACSSGSGVEVTTPVPEELVGMAGVVVEDHMCSWGGDFEQSFAAPPRAAVVSAASRVVSASR